MAIFNPYGLNLNGTLMEETSTLEYKPREDVLIIVVIVFILLLKEKK